MQLASSSLILGIAFAVVAGIMNGTFTLPMRFLGRWSWENVWALFIVVCCVVMPIAIAYITIPEFMHVLDAAPLHSILIPVGTGFAWDLGDYVRSGNKRYRHFNGQHLGTRHQRITVKMRRSARQKLWTAAASCLF